MKIKNVAKVRCLIHVDHEMDNCYGFSWLFNKITDDNISLVKNEIFINDFKSQGLSDNSLCKNLLVENTLHESCKEYIEDILMPTIEKYTSGFYEFYGDFHGETDSIENDRFKDFDLDVKIAKLTETDVEDLRDSGIVG